MNNFVEMISNDIYNDLESAIDLEYKDFNSKITNSPTPMLGVRVPQLRAYSKIALKKYGLGEILLLPNGKYVEFEFIKGFAVAYCSMDLKEKCVLLQHLSSTWDNWAVCDSTAATIKLKKGQDEIYFPFLIQMVSQSNVFSSRFGLVSLLDHFVVEKYFDSIVKALNCLPHDDRYYVEMATAWLIAEMLIKFYDKTLNYLLDSNCNLSNFVYNKSISKACESYRVTKEQKLFLKSLKK